MNGFIDIASGNRTRIQLTGRNLQVISVTALGDESNHLTLDLSSVLSRARIAAIRGSEIEIDCFMPVRTGYLHGTYLERQSDGTWQRITEAANPDMDRTIVQLTDRPPG